MQDGISMGRKDATNGVHLTKHIYLQLNTYTRMYSQSNHAQDRDKDTSKGKHYDRQLFINVQALKQFYLQDTAPPTFIQKKRLPPKTRAPDRVWRGTLWSRAWLLWLYIRVYVSRVNILILAHFSPCKWMGFFQRFIFFSLKINPPFRVNIDYDSLFPM